MRPSGELLGLGSPVTQRAACIPALCFSRCTCDFQGGSAGRGQSDESGRGNLGPALVRRRHLGGPETENVTAEGAVSPATSQVSPPVSIAPSQGGTQWGLGLAWEPAVRNADSGPPSHSAGDSGRGGPVPPSLSGGLASRMWKATVLGSVPQPTSLVGKME